MLFARPDSPPGYFSVNQVPVCLTYSSVDLARHRQALGRARGWGRQDSVGRGGNSLCFTDMNIQNLNSSVPACLFPELSHWPVSPELGSCCAKAELAGAVSESGVPGCSVPSPLAPSELEMSSTRFLGHMGQLCPNPLPGAHYIAPPSTLTAGHY